MLIFFLEHIPKGFPKGIAKRLKLQASSSSEPIHANRRNKSPAFKKIEVDKQGEEEIQVSYFFKHAIDPR